MHEPEPFEPIEVEEIPEIQFRPSNIRVSKIENNGYVEQMKSNPFEMIPEEESGFMNATHRSEQEN
jgi:hypothetical protein